MKLGVAFVAAALALGFAQSATADDSGFDDRAANNPLVAWEGRLFITAVNPTCEAAGWGIGANAGIAFRPRLDPAEPTSGLNLDWDRAMSQLRRTGGTGTDKMQGAGTYNGARFNTRGTFNSWTGTYSFALTPTNPIATTPNIILTGLISNFDDFTGCTVTVRAALTRRP